MKLIDWLGKSPLDPVCIILADVDWESLAAALPRDETTTTHGLVVPYFYFSGVKIMKESTQSALEHSRP